VLDTQTQRNKQENLKVNKHVVQIVKLEIGYVPGIAIADLQIKKHMPRHNKTL
jgi:hypothetical protein